MLPMLGRARFWSITVGIKQVGLPFFLKRIKVFPIGQVTEFVQSVLNKTSLGPEVTVGIPLSVSRS